MALLFIDGFDYGHPTTPKWDSVGGGNNFVANNGRRTNTAAFNCYSAAGEATKTFGGTNSTIIKGWAFKSGAPSSVGSYRFLEFFEGTTLHLYFQFVVSGASPNYTVRCFRGDGTTLFTDTTVIDLSIWNYLELKVTISDTVGAVVGRLNGVQIFNQTALDTKNGGTGYVNKFKISNPHAGFSNYWVDDLYVADTTAGVVSDFVGDCRVDTLYPNADSSVAFTKNGGANNYGRLSETPYDGNTTYVSSANANDIDRYGITSIPVTNPSIKGVQVNVYAEKDDTALRMITPLVQVGGTDYSGSPVALVNGTYGMYYQLYEKNPNTSAQWALSEVNAMHPGFKVT